MSPHPFKRTADISGFCQMIAHSHKMALAQRQTREPEGFKLSWQNLKVMHSFAAAAAFLLAYALWRILT